MTVYKVYITPRTAQYTYGTEIDVSDHIDQSGVGNITQSADSTDFAIGLFFFGDITLKGFNKQGYFNDPLDTRSIFFPFSRDLAKVRVVFSNEDGDTVTFNGLINESGTTIDVVNEEITFTVLTRDSIIRDDSVSGGTIGDGVTAKAAFAAILNVPRINSNLTYSDANNNPGFDFTIDDGSQFDNMTKKDAVSALLAASNSVMLIDPDGNIIIKDRSDNGNAEVLSLYGKFDVYGRENILGITEYNTGIQRMFTSIIVKDSINNTETEKHDTAMVQTYGLRQQSFDFPFITDTGTQALVAQNILDTFKVPKIELVVTLKTALVLETQLFDLVSINYPLRIKPANNLFLPVVGQTKIGDATSPLPYTFGSTVIDPNIAFKVIQITHDEKQFVSTLKLRQIGTSLSDGTFIQPQAYRIGYAVVGDGVIRGTDADETWNPSVVGAARVGNTLTA